MNKTLKIIIAVFIVITVLLIAKIIFDKNDNLVKLGYSKRESKTIRKNLSKDEIKKIDKYYENFVEYSNVKYFHIENIDRYDKMKETNDYDINELIMRVNASVDKPFYTDVKTIDNPDDILLLVNKYYAFPDGYEPKDLVAVESTYMRSEAANAILKMVKAMRSNGLTINLLSGYRSYNTQISLYNRYVNKDGKEKADTYSARASHSEHQSGLAMDLSNNWSLTEEFENTKEFAWLRKHAHEYGFILRYTKDKEYLTGYVYEPWHYRYVGVDEATIIHEKDITYEEYCVLYRGLY